MSSGTVVIELTDKEFTDIRDAIWCAIVAHEIAAEREKHVAERLHDAKPGRNYHALVREARRWRYLATKIRKEEHS